VESNPLIETVVLKCKYNPSTYFLAYCYYPPSRFILSISSAMQLRVFLKEFSAMMKIRSLLFVVVNACEYFAYITFDPAYDQTNVAKFS
jgi:hypothetical protein